MCGLGGILAPGGVDLAHVARLNAATRHRGPDDEGFVVLDPERGYVSYRGDDTVASLGSLPHWKAATGSFPVALCHRRLSILDLTAAGHQPMVSADGNLVLVFNGEIYNYVELADELESLGWSLRPCGDTAVLLAALMEWGPACAERLRGMWALAVYDRRADRLTLSRDRFGIKPLYYARVGQAFVFASEIKGILASLEHRPRGALTEVVRMLVWGALDDGERTLFEDVREVPAGTHIHVRMPDLSITTERYYDIDARPNERFNGNLDDGIERYLHQFDESIRLHLRSDVRVGTCLSGGLDSSLIAARALPQLNGAPLAAFTAVYEDPAVDERTYVELQAAHSGRIEPHFVTPSGQTLLEDMDRFILAQDLPVASSSPYAQWVVMRLAGASGLKVLLDGQGADEAIGGYSYFAGAYLVDLLTTGRFVDAIAEMRRLRTRRGIRVSSEIARAASRRLPEGLARVARRRFRLGTHLVRRPFRSAAGGQPYESPGSYRDYSIDALRRNLPRLLRYEDRSSMAFSIESRVPFLDHPFVELVLSLPTEMKFRDGWSKFVQRSAAEPFVPREIVWRREKIGFATPQREWHAATRATLAPRVAAADIPDFLDRARIVELVNSDLQRPAELSEYWQAMFLIRWMTVFDVDFE